ncbi:hypothetical protein AB0K18_45795 [Nonomuraea sp. NPDC049421]|uniref:hypothetical protein n=1 Tax=Nonomuraea sp. NPDC049421 TaxID=3155275 RepID=UPI00343BF154
MESELGFAAFMRRTEMPDRRASAKVPIQVVLAMMAAHAATAHPLCVTVPRPIPMGGRSSKRPVIALAAAGATRLPFSQQPLLDRRKVVDQWEIAREGQ